jgi:acyl-CoA dehydrogenase
VVKWALEDSLYQAQRAMVGICDNFPIPLVGGLMRRVVMPLGARLRPPSDQLGHRVAQLIQQPGEARDRLSAGLYYELDRRDPVGLAEMCLRKVIAAEPIEQKLRKSLGRNIAPHDFESAIAEGLAQGIVNDIEARTVREAMELTTLVIQVDEFGEHRVPVEDRQPAATG